MKKTPTLLAIGVGVLLTGAAVLAQDNEPGPIDTQAAVDRPVEREKVDGRSQVVNLALTFEKGAVQSAEVVSSEVVESDGPNLFGRAGGEWLVRVEGDAGYEFFTMNPGWREAEADNENGYEWVPVTGTVEWPLVLPLTFGDRRLDAIKSLTIIDTVTGDRLFEVQL